MKRTVLECCHADTCLPDYWSGHHLPHVQVPVDSRTTFAELRRSLLSELAEGAVMGSDHMAYQIALGMDDESHRLYQSAKAAVRRLRPLNKGARRAFPRLERETEDTDTVYAFFVFRPMEL